MTTKWKRFIVGVACGAAIGCTVTLVGGCVSQGQVPAADIQKAVSVITGEYKTYIAEDATLDSAEKAKRTRTADMLKELVDSAAQPDEVVQ